MGDFATMIIRRPPEGEVVATVPFPEGTEGHGLVDYVVTHKPPLRKGMPDRYLVWLVLVADGKALNDNLPVACRSTREAAIARATVPEED